MSRRQRVWRGPVGPLAAHAPPPLALPLFLSLALAVPQAAFPGPAHADKTRLYEVDYKTGAKRKIDGGEPKTDSDRELDGLLDKAAGGASFSSDDLEKIETALRRYLAAARPRATPRLLLFLYPGRISLFGLKELREIVVDVDLLVEPCSRAVCKDSVRENVELLGKAMRQAVIKTTRYTLRFGTITIRTTEDARGSSFDVYRFTADEVVGAGRSADGGRKLMARLQAAQDRYDQEMTKEVARSVRARRVVLARPPALDRGRASISVALEIQSDRVRYREQVFSAFAGAAEALARSPLTPPNARLRVVASIPMRRVETRTFTCFGQPLGLYLAGKLDQTELWSTYIVEQKRGQRKLTFDDAEADGREAPSEDEGDRTDEILSSHSSLLGACLGAEASRNPRFKGGTIRFAISQAGVAEGVSFKETASPKVLACVREALAQIRFQRHGGAPKLVDYPMLIRR
jgi:hypothetical protein